MRRTLARLFLRLRFLALQQHRHGRLVLERDLGYPLVVLPGVLNPTLFLTTEVFVDYLGEFPLPHGCSVLDLGTGSGALAVVAAGTAGRVVAVDLNPEGVRCARLNLLLNRVEDRCEVHAGDLFESVADLRFDRVVCNPPYHRGTPTNNFEQALYSPDFAERFATELPDHLTEGGNALVILSSEGDETGFLTAFRAASLAVERVRTVRRFAERISIYKISCDEGVRSEPVLSSAAGSP